MRVPIIFLLIGVFPSIAIFYFTYGNWPLAYDLQVDYFIILLVLFVAINIYFSNAHSSSSRNSSPIGYAGMLIPMILLVLPVILLIGGISFFYKDLPASEPGLLHSTVKWASIVILIVSSTTVTYSTIKRKMRYRKYRKSQNN